MTDPDDIANGYRKPEKGEYCCPFLKEKVEDGFINAEYVDSEWRYFVSLEMYPSENKIHVHNRLWYCPYCGEKLK